MKGHPGITHIGGDRYRVRVTAGYDPSTGKQLIVSRNMRGTVREADALHEQLRRQYGSPDAVLYGRMSVYEFVSEEWLPTRKLRPSTKRGYDATLRNHIRPNFERVRLNDATPITITKVLARIESPGAALNAYKMLRSAFGYAADSGIIAYNPMARVEKPEPPEYDADVYSLTEVLDAFDAVRGMDIEPGILIAATCGTRASETCALDWQDLELAGQRGSVIITKGYHRLPGKRVTTDPKTKRSKRTIAIPGFVVERLLEIRGDGRIGPLMRDRTGQRMTPGGFSQRWRRLTTPRDAKDGRRIYAPPVRHIPLKNLRHSQSTILLDLGATMHEVSLRDGHSRESTTDGFYNQAHRNRPADHSVAERMDKAARGTRRDINGHKRAGSGGA